MSNAQSLESVVRFIRGVRDARTILEEHWIGRRVRLIAPVGKDLVPAGTTGTIVRITNSEDAPFAVKFDGFEVTTAPLISKLEIVS